MLETNKLKITDKRASRDSGGSLAETGGRGSRAHEPVSERQQRAVKITDKRAGHQSGQAARQEPNLVPPVRSLGVPVRASPSSAPTRSRTARRTTLDMLCKMTPTGFEQYVADVLRAAGWGLVTVVGGPGDRGADIEATDLYNRKVIVQAKRWASGHLVGEPPVRLLLGDVVVHGADRGLLVTTSRFTQPATILANKHGIALVDGEALLRWAQGLDLDARETASEEAWRRLLRELLDETPGKRREALARHYALTPPSYMLPEGRDLIDEVAMRAFLALRDSGRGASFRGIVDRSGLTKLQAMLGLLRLFQTAEVNEEFGNLTLRMTWT